MHLIDMENSFLGANGIVGGGIPIAVGGALAISYRYEKRVTMCVLGDGAVNQGTFHEGLNLAAIWNLPIIFLVKNNFYALSTPVGEVCPTDSISVKATAYAIPGKTINGNDVEMVRSTVSIAIKRAREGKGPSLIECLTYRLLGHSKSDDRGYRTNEEERKWREREPIKEYKKKLINEGIASQEELALIDKEVEVDVNRALKFSLASTDPNPENLTTHVYVDV